MSRLPALLLALAACSNDGPHERPAEAIDTATPTASDAFELGACLSGGGGRLDDITCNKAWDCDDASYEITCQDRGDGVETCTCWVDGAATGRFDADAAGGVCGGFSDAGWADDVAAWCGFPDGAPGTTSPTSTGGSTAVRTGYDEVVGGCSPGMPYTVSAMLYDPVAPIAEAELIALWTGVPSADDYGFFFWWTERYAGSLTDLSNAIQPKTRVEATSNSTYNFDCQQFQTEITFVLRVGPPNGRSTSCLIWGHAVDDVLGADLDRDVTWLNDRLDADDIAGCEVLHGGPAPR